MTSHHQTQQAALSKHKIEGFETEDQQKRNEDVFARTADKRDDGSLSAETIVSPPTGDGTAIGRQDSHPTIHPFVHWAQSHTHISLRVDLVQVEDLRIEIEGDRKFVFFGRGTGAHGLKDYNFTLTFFSEVDKKFDCHTIERYVLILIKKANLQSNWPRLTQQATKLPWLRVDFDRYAGDDSDDTDYSSEEELDRKAYESLQEQLKQQQKDNEPNSDQSASSNSWAKSVDKIFSANSRTNFDIFNPFNKRPSKSKESSNKMKYDYRKDAVGVDSSKNTARNALDCKKTYLFIYNLLMFIMFLKVYIVLVIKGISGTVDDDIVQGAAFIIKLLTWTQLLESVHPMLGLVPGGPMMPLLQVTGRLLVNNFLTEDEIRLNSAPYAHYLFVVWSSIEIFRYSFYALRVFKVSIYPLTWCRYTLFMPLYPMGGFCEAMVIASTIKLYEKTGKYSVSLPNSANISFSAPLMLRIYTYLLLGPSIYYLMTYMWKQRTKQLKEKVA